MMIDINDIKNGMTVIIDGQIYQIVDFLHVKPGKGSAFMKMKLKNLRAGTTLEKTMNTNIKLEKANITQDELAKKVGKSRSHITNMLGLLRLPQSVQDMVLYNKISI